jgi:hypothetical protein
MILRMNPPSKSTVSEARLSQGKFLGPLLGSISYPVLDHLKKPRISSMRLFKEIIIMSLGTES